MGVRLFTNLLYRYMLLHVWRVAQPTHSRKFLARPEAISQQRRDVLRLARLWLQLPNHELEETHERVSNHRPSGPHGMSKRDRLIIVLCYLTVYIVWGSTYFAIKHAVETIPPYYVIGIRFTIGGLILLLFSYLTGRIKPWPTPREILAALFLGVFLLVIGNGLITVAEQKVDSYLASLAVAATPIFVAFFDRFVIGKRISALRLAAIAIGMAGVATLLYDGHSLSSSLAPEILMVVGGVASWGFATSLGHRLHVYKDSLVNSSLQMILVGVISLIASSFLYPPLPQILPRITRDSGLGLAYLALFGSLAYAAYNYLIAHEPAARAVSYALVNPVIALFLGLLLGNETPAPLLAAGLPLVLTGVFLMLYGETSLALWRRWIKGRAWER